VFVQQILKMDHLPLEPRRAHVRDVVRDDFDVLFLGHHAGSGSVKSAHGFNPFSDIGFAGGIRAAARDPV
jgi:hypothetical protein